MFMYFLLLHWPQSGTYKHPRRAPIREAADYPYTPADLTVQSLNDIVCPDFRPVFAGKIVIGQGFQDSASYYLCSFRQFHGFLFLHTAFHRVFSGFS